MCEAWLFRGLYVNCMEALPGSYFIKARRTTCDRDQDFDSPLDRFISGIWSLDIQAETL